MPRVSSRIYAHSLQILCENSSLDESRCTVFVSGSVMACPFDVAFCFMLRVLCKSCECAPHVSLRIYAHSPWILSENSENASLDKSPCTVFVSGFAMVRPFDVASFSCCVYFANRASARRVSLRGFLCTVCGLCARITTTQLRDHCDLTSD